MQHCTAVYCNAFWVLDLWKLVSHGHDYFSIIWRTTLAHCQSVSAQSTGPRMTQPMRSVLIGQNPLVCLALKSLFHYFMLCDDSTVVLCLDMCRQLCFTTSCYGNTGEWHVAHVGHPHPWGCTWPARLGLWRQRESAVCVDRDFIGVNISDFICMEEIFVWEYSRFHWELCLSLLVLILNTCVVLTCMWHTTGHPCICSAVHGECKRWEATGIPTATNPGVCAFADYCVKHGQVKLTQTNT